MDTGIIVNICLSVLSFILAAISVITVVITLRQNNRMIEASTRPVLSFYTTVLSSSGQMLFFVVRNYGASSAVIKSISGDKDFSKFLLGAEQLDSTTLKKFSLIDQLNGAVIAPGQSRICPLDYSQAPEMITITVVYTSINGKEYSEKTNVAVKAGNNLLHISSGNSNHDISKSVYDIANCINELLQRSL